MNALELPVSGHELLCDVPCSSDVIPEVLHKNVALHHLIVVLFLPGLMSLCRDLVVSLCDDPVCSVLGIIAETSCPIFQGLYDQRQMIFGCPTATFKEINIMHGNAGLKNVSQAEKSAGRGSTQINITHAVSQNLFFGNLCAYFHK